MELIEKSTSCPYCCHCFNTNDIRRNNHEFQNLDSGKAVGLLRKYTKEPELHRRRDRIMRTKHKNHIIMSLLGFIAFFNLLISLPSYAQAPVSVAKNHVLFLRNEGEYISEGTGNSNKRRTYDGFCFVSVRGIIDKKYISNIKVSNPIIHAYTDNTIIVGGSGAGIQVYVSNVSKKVFNTVHKITFDVKKGGKKYRLKTYVKLIKYDAPFSDLKIGKLNMLKKANSQRSSIIKPDLKKKVKIKVTPKKGYAIKEITIQNQRTLKSRSVVNGASVKLKKRDLIIIDWVRINKSTSSQFTKFKQFNGGTPNTLATTVFYVK